MTASRTPLPVVVVGAGQAGLSVAYYLRRFDLVPGVDFLVLDRGATAGGAWQYRWDALTLGSAHRVNDLPGLDALGLSFDHADRTRPASEVVTEYYARYEEHYDLQVRRPVDVRAVRNAGADLRIEYRDLAEPVVPPEPAPEPEPEPAPRGFFGRFGRRRADDAEPEPGREPELPSLTARILVNATGTWGAPFRPHYPGAGSFAGRQVHTADYVSAEEFRDQRVIVVGGGTSAIGFMLELERVASHLTWVARRPIDWLERADLDVEGASAAVAMQDEAARAGRALPSIVSGTGVPMSRRFAAGIARGLLVARPMFERIEPDGVRFADGTFEPADAIIWATGFRPDVRHLAPLRLRSADGGLIVANGESWTDPRVFLAGYGPQASTIGANRAGRMIARQIVGML
ncbi:NAD(P)-binding domain-containing protein [Agromyces atrinae]|uniref:NAD(P)-binding domain-containing protein n=1 Tax=Agromyces atrinae TaxID=592376 RepID=UPI001F5816B5|nr:NAD(P)-binding domain-containing protein [Agromyces atrinae]MCI2956379.1 NAD(P)-binding domain-containing protein [Agromyces atrinae]